MSVFAILLTDPFRERHERRLPLVSSNRWIRSAATAICTRLPAAGGSRLDDGEHGRRARGVEPQMDDRVVAARLDELDDRLNACRP